MNKKIFLAGLLCLASVASVVGTVGNAREVEAAAPTTVYLDPACWDASSARFAAYFWDTAAATWHNMSDSDGDGIFEVKVPANCSKVIFCRMNKTSTANNWNNKWNQSNDLTIPTDGKNLYTISDWGGDKSPGSWGTYVEPGVSLMGTLTDWTGGTTMTKQSNGTYTLDLTVDTVAEHKLKVKIGNTWIGDGTLNVKGLTLKTTDKDNNIIFDAAKGTYHFEFVMSSKTLNVTFTAAPDYDAEVKDLLSTYYNGGVYLRHTEINLSEDAKNELVKCFHAESNLLVRDTYFKGEELWMTHHDSGYSYYGTKGSDTVYARTEEANVTPEKTSVAIKGKGMTTYFTTLKNIKDNTAEWTKTENVYSTTDQAVIKMFLDFTAPCFLGLDENNLNYWSMTSVQVEETANGLELRLITSGDEGKLTDAKGVLSVATITTK